jgi:hypothetical protein
MSEGEATVEIIIIIVTTTTTTTTIDVGMRSLDQGAGRDLHIIIIIMHRGITHDIGTRRRRANTAVRRIAHIHLVVVQARVEDAIEGGAEVEERMEVLDADRRLRNIKKNVATVTIDMGALQIQESRA